MAGVSEAMSAQSPPSSTPNWLERLFLCLEVVLGEPSQTQSLPHGQGGGAVPGGFGGAARGEQTAPLL